MFRYMHYPTPKFSLPKIGIECECGLDVVPGYMECGRCGADGTRFVFCHSQDERNPGRNLIYTFMDTTEVIARTGPQETWESIGLKLIQDFCQYDEIGVLLQVKWNGHMGAVHLVKSIR